VKVGRLAVAVYKRRAVANDLDLQEQILLMHALLPGMTPHTNARRGWEHVATYALRNQQRMCTVSTIDVSKSHGAALVSPY
jgi:hypothetical protein